MKKILALILTIALCALCFLVSCRDTTNDKKEPSTDSSGEIEGGENNDNPIIDIGGNESDGNGGGILNEDNIDPNGWTKVD